MAAADVPTAASRVCTDARQAAAALDEFGPPYVVKDDGLAAGKGVVVTTDRNTALEHASHCARVVIEEFLDGPEVSLFAITDGNTVVPLLPAQDFKRVADGDQGPNTGGMGAYAPLPWAPKTLVDEVMRDVLQPTVDEMRRRGTPFAGLLYAGLALTSNGTRVVEFNARFGDPETQVVLALLQTPIAGLLNAAATGTLADHPPLTVARGTRSRSSSLPPGTRESARRRRHQRPRRGAGARPTSCTRARRTGGRNGIGRRARPVGDRGRRHTCSRARRRLRRRGGDRPRRRLTTEATSPCSPSGVRSRCRVRATWRTRRPLSGRGRKDQACEQRTKRCDNGWAMTTPQIPDVLATRYASAALVELWSPRAKVALERQLWIAVLKAQAELGIDVPPGVVDDYARVVRRRRPRLDHRAREGHPARREGAHRGIQRARRARAHPQRHDVARPHRERRATAGARIAAHHPRPHGGHAGPARPARGGARRPRDGRSQSQRRGAGDDARKAIRVSAARSC